MTVDRERTAHDAEDVTIRSDARFRGVDFERVTLAPGQQRARFLDRYAIAVIDFGSGRFRCGSEEFEAYPAAGYFLGPQCLWTARSAVTAALRYQTLFIEASMVAQLNEQGFQGSLEFPAASARVLTPDETSAVRRMVQQFTVGSRFTARLAALTDLVLALGSDPRIEKMRTEPVAITRARTYLLERWAGDVRLSQLARQASLSRFHFVRVFRETVGVPPRTYSILLRVCGAERLLREGVSIAEAAHVAGFYDQSHLSRCFHRFVGVTPGQYRKNLAHQRPRITLDTVLAYRLRDGVPLLRRWVDMRAAILSKTSSR